MEKEELCPTLLWRVQNKNECKKVKGLGPIGKAEGIEDEELKTRLAKVRKLVPYIKIAKNSKLV